MKKIKNILSAIGRSILNDIIKLPAKILIIAFVIFVSILKIVSGFFMWGGLILGILVLTGNASWDENWGYLLVGLVAFIARYLSDKIIGTT